MPESTENVIYQKAAKCWEYVNQSIQIFSALLKKEETFNTSDYYRARNLMREADEFYAEARKSAKKLLGPTPSYVSEDFHRWRDQLLEEFHILATSQEFEDLRSELLGDELLREWMTESEIDVSIRKHFQQQQSGKRKLPNIKVRIILNHLEGLLTQAKGLNKEALQKQQMNF